MMKPVFAGISAALLLMFIVELAPAQNSQSSLKQFSGSLQELSLAISPSVVQITGTGYGLQPDEQQGANVLSKQRSTGSGIVMSEDGYIMTNAHVVEGTRAVRVKLNGMRNSRNAVFDAKLVGKDRLLDLALLKIDAT